MKNEESIYNSDVKEDNSELLMNETRTIVSEDLLDASVILGKSDFSSSHENKENEEKPEVSMVEEKTLNSEKINDVVDDALYENRKQSTNELSGLLSNNIINSVKESSNECNIINSLVLETVDAVEQDEKDHQINEEIESLELTVNIKKEIQQEIKKELKEETETKEGTDFVEVSSLIINETEKESSDHNKIQNDEEVHTESIQMENDEMDNAERKETITLENNLESEKDALLQEKEYVEEEDLSKEEEPYVSTQVPNNAQEQKQQTNVFDFTSKEDMIRLNMENDCVNNKEEIIIHSINDPIKEDTANLIMDTVSLNDQSKEEYALQLTEVKEESSVVNNETESTNIVIESGEAEKNVCCHSVDSSVKKEDPIENSQEMYLQNIMNSINTSCLNESYNENTKEEEEEREVVEEENKLKVMIDENHKNIEEEEEEEEEKECDHSNNNVVDISEKKGMKRSQLNEKEENYKNENYNEIQHNDMYVPNIAAYADNNHNSSNNNNSITNNSMSTCMPSKRRKSEMPRTNDHPEETLQNEMIQNHLNTKDSVRNTLQTFGNKAFTTLKMNEMKPQVFTYCEDKNYYLTGESITKSVDLIETVQPTTESNESNFNSHVENQENTNVLLNQEVESVEEPLKDIMKHELNDSTETTTGISYYTKNEESVYSNSVPVCSPQQYVSKINMNHMNMINRKQDTRGNSYINVQRNQNFYNKNEQKYDVTKSQHTDRSENEKRKNGNDKQLPITNISRIMKKILPVSAKVAKDSKDIVRDCATEFIQFLASEAGDQCTKENKKTICGEDIIVSMERLGFNNYVKPLTEYLNKLKQLKNVSFTKDSQMENPYNNFLKE